MEHNLEKARVTLAHKRSHGVTAVAGCELFLHQKVPVELTALLFTDEMAALEAEISSVDGEKAVPKNEWPHVMDRRKNGSQGGQQIASIASGGKKQGDLKSIHPSPYLAHWDCIEFFDRSS